MRYLVLIIVGIILLVLIETYFVKKVKKSLKKSFKGISNKKTKRWQTLLLLVTNIYPAFLIFNWLFSDLTKSPAYVPQNSFFDYFIIYPFWFIILLFVQCDLFFLIVDSIKFILYPFWKNQKERIHSVEAKIILALVAIFIIYVPSRIIYDYNKISIRIVEYKKKGLPTALNNFKIALISDLQADRYTDQRRLSNYISKVNSTHPDLVLMGGDVITSTPDYIDEAADYIGKIKSKYGIYSCVGDHDNWAYRNDYKRSLTEVEDALDKKNVEMLDDTEKKINIGKSKIGITFITNTYVGQVPRKTLDSLTSKSNSVDLKILLVHQPRKFVIAEGVKKNYDLILAGHTHGGQVTFLFPFINLSPTLIETPYVRGDFHFGNTLLIVTRGLGMSLAPVRYNSTPEITLIVLENK